LLACPAAKLFRTVARIAATGVAVWFIGSAGHTAYGLSRTHFDSRPVINFLDDTPAHVLFEDHDNDKILAAALGANLSGNNQFLEVPRREIEMEEISRKSDKKITGRTRHLLCLIQPVCG
jgi:hypothetical protein